MIAIHSVTAIRAIRGAARDSNYITLEISQDHFEDGTRTILLDLYFTKREPGELYLLADVINSCELRSFAASGGPPAQVLPFSKLEDPNVVS